jgi:hypothetical protein
MLCEVTSAVTEFMVCSRMLLDQTMLCDVTSAATEFMVRVLHSRMLLDRSIVSCLKPASCVISLKLQFAWSLD